MVWTVAPPATGSWTLSDHLDEVLWTVRGDCPCGLGHVGPQGCTAGVALPAAETVIFATGFEEGQAAGENLAPGARSALFSQKSPNFDGMPYIVSDFVHAGSYSWQCNLAHCNSGLTKGISPALSAPYTLSYKLYFYIVGAPGTGVPSGLIDFFHSGASIASETGICLHGGINCIGMSKGMLGGGGSSTVATYSSPGLSLNQWYRMVFTETVAANGTDWTQSVNVYLGDTMTLASSASASGTNNNMLGRTIVSFGMGDIWDLDGGIDYRIDDLIISASQALSTDPYAIAIAVPNSDTSVSWTRHGSPAESANYLTVGDFPGTLADTTKYNQATALGQIDKFGLDISLVPHKNLRQSYVYVYDGVTVSNPMNVRVWDENGTITDGVTLSSSDAGAQTTDQMFIIRPRSRGILGQYKIGYISGNVSGVGAGAKVYHQWVNVEYDPT